MRFSGGAAGRQVALIVASIFFLVPAYIVVINSFKTQKDVLQSPLGAPWDRLTTDAYADALTSSSFNVARAYVFSAIITVSVVILVIAVASSVSYVLARSESWLARVAFVGILASLMIPPQVVIIPAVQVLRSMGLIGTVPGLILYDVAANLPLAVFIFYGFIRTIPREMDESASIDGAGTIGTFVKVIFPMLTPATASLAVLLAVFVWNDFLNPLIILGPFGEATVTTGIYRAAGLYSTDWSSVFAFVCLSSAPMLILFIVLQRYVIRGLTGGAVKG